MWNKIRYWLDGGPIEDLSVCFVTTRGHYYGWWGTYIAGPFVFLAGLLRAAWAMAFRQVDILHISLASGGSAVRKLAFAALANVFRVPYVIHLRGAEFEKYWNSRSRPMASSIDWMFDHAAAVIVLGTFWRRVVLNRRPGLSARVIVLPNATVGRQDPPAPRPDGSPVEILFLGRLERRKGTPDLVEALAALRARSDRHALLAGDGDIAQTRDAVARHGLAGQVEVPGWLGEEQVEEALNAADILVLPSYDEGLPNAVVEAFGHGLAVVTTPVGAVPDIVEEGVTGLLIRPGDIGALTAAIQRLVDDRELRRRLGEGAARVHRERLGINAHVSGLVRIWRGVADGSFDRAEAGEDKQSIRKPEPVN